MRTGGAAPPGHRALGNGPVGDVEPHGIQGNHLVELIRFAEEHETVLPWDPADPLGGPVRVLSRQRAVGAGLPGRVGARSTPSWIAIVTLAMSVKINAPMAHTALATRISCRLGE